MQDIEFIYKKAQPLKLPAMSYQTIDYVGQKVDPLFYQYVLSRTGAMIITLNYTEKTEDTLVKLIKEIGGTLHEHSGLKDYTWIVKPGGQTGNETLARSHRSDEFFMHTDCSYEENTPDFIGLHILHHDYLGGGKNLLIYCPSLIQHLSMEALSTLQNEEVEIRVPPEFKKNIQHINSRIIDNNFNVRYRKSLINFSKASKKMLEALAEFDNLCGRTELNRSLDLKAGQILLLSNKWFMHARTAIKDKDRSLIRTRFFTKFCNFGY
jgi:alpha-ketoglutarate-dependent taurine dioxygenase